MVIHEPINVKAKALPKALFSSWYRMYRNNRKWREFQDYSVGWITAELFVSRLVYRMAVNNKHSRYAMHCYLHPLLSQDKSYRQYNKLVQSYVIKVKLKSNRLLVLNIYSSQDILVGVACTVGRIAQLTMAGLVAAAGLVAVDQAWMNHPSHCPLVEGLSWRHATGDVCCACSLGHWLLPGKSIGHEAFLWWFPSLHSLPEFGHTQYHQSGGLEEGVPIGHMNVSVPFSVRGLSGLYGLCRCRLVEAFLLLGEASACICTSGIVLVSQECCLWVCCREQAGQGMHCFHHACL